jgi:hypothetical protein
MEKDYTGPERRTDYPNKRHMVLTADDISAIAAVVREHHVCRFGDISTEDMTEVIMFVKKVKRNVDEYSEGVRKTVIQIFVVGTFMGAIYFLETRFPFLRPLMKYLRGT